MKVVTTTPVYSMLHSLKILKRIFLAQNRALEVMKFLIGEGILPIYTDTLKQTALYYAAREGKLNCVEFLINQGNFIH
jgi:ankyrin repeat protein